MKMWDGRSGYSGRHRGLRGALLLLLAAAILFFAAVETWTPRISRVSRSK